MTDIQLPDAWVLDSGLREDMVLTVHSSYFAPHADYQDGKVLMCWLIGTDENEEPVEVRLSVGADWQTDSGEIITHPTKKKQHINKNSIYGHWLTYCFQIPELARTLISRSDDLGGHGPLDARVWIDLILHLESKEITFGRNIDSQQRLMPTEFFGLYEESAPAIVASTAPAPASPFARDVIAQARAAKAQQGAISNGSPLHARALQMAKDAPDYATFLGIALSDDEILADDELAVQVADESLIWAQAH